MVGAKNSTLQVFKIHVGTMIRRAFNHEFSRYLLAGGLAFACDIAVLYWCTEVLGQHYLLSTFLGYLVGLVVSYWLNISWVFKFRKYDRLVTEMTIFNLIVVAGVGLNQGLMLLLVEYAALNYLVAKVVTAALVMVFNYVGKKFLLFRPSAVRVANINHETAE